MNSFTISELKPGIFFTSDAMLDDKFILLSNATPLTETLAKALIEWDFGAILSEGNTTDKSQLPVQKKQTDDEKRPRLRAPVLPPQKDFSAMNAGIKSVMGAPGTEGRTSYDIEMKRLAVVEKVYNEYMQYTDTMFTRFATHKELDLKTITQGIKDMCIFIKDSSRYLLRVIQSADVHDTHFLTSHSLRTTVLAITIGFQLNLPLSKLVELGISCIVHELGMLKIPPHLYTTERLLTLSEKRILSTHPVLTYNILKDYGFPSNICLGALEHRERENSSGYPRKLNGSEISLYAKIIGVACTFESMTAGRRFKEAQNANAVLLELLRNTGNQYDENILKALLCSLSLYPIGTYVFLSDGKIGISVDTNPSDPKNPLIQLIYETDANGEPKIVQPGTRDLSITRALTETEITDLLKSMPDKKQERKS